MIWLSKQEIVDCNYEKIILSYTAKGIITMIWSSLDNKLPLTAQTGYQSYCFKNICTHFTSSASLLDAKLSNSGISRPFLNCFHFLREREELEELKVREDLHSLHCTLASLPQEWLFFYRQFFYRQLALILLKQQLLLSESHSAVYYL